MPPDKQIQNNETKITNKSETESDSKSDKKPTNTILKKKQ